MVKLRLKKMGSKFKTFYRLVAADARAPRDGRFIEEIGYYNPNTKEVFINLEKKDKWLSEGAVPTETVKMIFKKYAAGSGEAKDGIVILKTKPRTPKKKVVAEVTDKSVPTETKPEAETTKEG